MDASYGLKTGDHIPGPIIHKYFADFITKYDLKKRIRYSTKVVTAEKLANGWKLTTNTLTDAGITESTIITQKLMVATGITSRARSMKMPGQENFNAPIIDHTALKMGGPAMVKNANIKTVTVFGGSKTGYDCVYFFASNGLNVEWVIRKSGHGPTWMAHSSLKFMGQRFWIEKVAATRLISWFSPCIWGDADGFSWVRSLMHRTKVGRWLVDKFWKKMERDIIRSNKYRSHPELEKLIPDAR